MSLKLHTPFLGGMLKSYAFLPYLACDMDLIFFGGMGFQDRVSLDVLELSL